MRLITKAVTTCVPLIAFATYYAQHQNAMALEAVRAANAAAGSFAGRRAVVVGATSGIVRAIALRLAQADFSVTVVGRDVARGQEVLSELEKTTKGEHDFVSVDGSLMANAYRFAPAWALKHGESLDVLVLTQGIATLDGYTPTAEGLDRKLAVHYFGRMAFLDALLPALRKGRDPRVLTVFSAGLHWAYPHWATDPELRSHYSLKNAADAAGMYNDLGMDANARDPANANITFIHAAPGIVATRWGSDFPWPLRMLVRVMMNLASKDPADCAEFLVAPLLAKGEACGQPSGLRLIGEKGQEVPRTPVHEQAREPVWAHTRALLDGAKARAASPEEVQ